MHKSFHSYTSIRLIPLNVYQKNCSAIKHEINRLIAFKDPVFAEYIKVVKCRRERGLPVQSPWFSKIQETPATDGSYYVEGTISLKIPKARIESHAEWPTLIASRSTNFWSVGIYTVNFTKQLANP